jgi:hypothetical protein
MTRSTVLLLIVGLAIGLWLGFNPQAHQQTVQQWDSIKSSFLKFKTGASSNLPGLNFNSTSTTQTSSKSKSKFASQPQQPTAQHPTTQQPTPSFDWKQITTAFAPIWNSLQSIWASIMAKIGATR